MSGRSKRRHGDSPVVDVADVFADDALVDALLSETGSTGAGAAGFVGQEVGNGLGGGDPLIELFDIWRDEISSIPLPPAPAVRHASHAVAAGRHRQQRTARPAMLIAAAICALLIGSAAVGSRTARPGDSLWALASVLWSDRLASVHSLSEVESALAEVQTALDAGRPDAAREALMRATVQLGHVDDLDMPASIPGTVQKLWADVIPEAERRSTQATASAAAAAADQAVAQPEGSPSSTLSSAAGTSVAATPLLGTILEAIIASNQPQASTDPSTSSAGPPTIADSSTLEAAVDPSLDASIDPKTDAPTESASATPTPPPVTTDPAPETPPAVPVEPTADTTASGDQTSTENSAPEPPPASTEPSPEPPVPSIETSTPTGSSGSDPAAFGLGS